MDRPTFLTKIRLPQRRPDILCRSRLVDFLHQHVDKRLILLCAAAGYGKTTLLADFAHDVDLPVCWYSMDASDADPRTFFEYLLHSIRQRFPGFGRQTESLLNSVGDVSRETNSIVASLINEIETDISEYFLLVLDDYHWVDDTESVNSALDLLIYYLPDNCHLVLSTRTLPRLTFSRLAAQRQVAGLGTTDLRFTGDELSRLLRDNYKLVMPATQVQRLTEASEGWITGILLTTHTLWMGIVESLVKARGAESPLFDYLANEIYLHQPPDVQQFLLASSVLEQMSPEWCDRLIGGSTAAEMLRYLARANLFISQLEGTGEWYRYHNLFRDFLQTKLKSDDPDLHARLHRRAGEMAEAEGELDWALGHYHAAGALDCATAMVETAGEGMVRTGRWQTLSRWLDSLPAETVDARAKLSLYRGRTCIWSGELDRAVAHLERTSHHCRALGDIEGASDALVLKSVGLRLKGRLAEALRASVEALALLDGGSSRVAAAAHQEKGICLAAQGKLHEATLELRQALEMYEAAGNEAGAANICQAMGILAVRMGDLAQGMAYYRQALASWQHLASAASTAEVLNCIAMVHYYTGEYQQALTILEEALAKARQSGYLRIEAWVLSSLGEVRCDSGNLQAALESYENALDIAQRVDENQLVNYLLNGLSNTHRVLGDYATAERLLRQAMQQAGEGDSLYDIASYSISAGVLAEEQGDLDRAEKLLRSAAEQLASSGARRDLARAHFHLARVLFGDGREAEAVRELETSLELCRQLGYDQFMVAEGQRAGELISRSVSRGVGGRRLELVAERLQVARQPVQVRKRPRIRVEPSGPRQIQVYSLGQSQVWLDSRCVTSSDWAVEKTKELFFYLLDQSRSLRKEQIVDGLWPELELGKSNSQFHSTMYRLRRALFPQCVAYHDGRYQVAVGNVCWFDAEEFGRLLSEAEHPDTQVPQRLDCYTRALDLYKGPFLEEFYSDWVIPRREELELRHLQTLARLAKLRAETGALEQAVELLRTAVAIDPFREEAHYGLIHYTALMGDGAAALHHYRTYAQLLRDELSSNPGPSVRLLAECISRGQPVPSASRPPR